MSDAQSNFERLKANPYPGRGIVMGMINGFAIQVYWIMGRSENSRNRVFEKDDSGRVFTVAADPSKVKDPSLIIYNAMHQSRDHYVVSNGKQTDAVLAGLLVRRTAFEVLQEWSYEPDAPNFTPRITGMFHRNACVFDLVIVRRNPLTKEPLRTQYLFDDIRRGTGYCITTYDSDGDPLPSFSGDPYMVPLDLEIDLISETFWNALNPENRVSLAVKSIDIRTGYTVVDLVNKYKKVS